MGVGREEAYNLLLQFAIILIFFLCFHQFGFPFIMGNFFFVVGGKGDKGKFTVLLFLLLSFFHFYSYIFPMVEWLNECIFIKLLYFEYSIIIRFLRCSR